MPPEIPTASLLLCLVFGSLTGYLVYLITLRIEAVDLSGMKPFGILAYIGLLVVGKNAYDVIESDFWIIVSIFIAFWMVGIVMRGNSITVFDRIIFFGCALLIAPFVAPLIYLLLAFGYSIVDVRIKRWDGVEHGELLVIYMVSTLASIFAAPLMKHLYQFAMSMRPKPN